MSWWQLKLAMVAWGFSILSFNTFFRFSITNKNFKYLNTLAPKLYCKSIFSCILNNDRLEKRSDLLSPRACFQQCGRGWNFLFLLLEEIPVTRSLASWCAQPTSLEKEVPGLEAPTTAPWHILSQKQKVHLGGTQTHSISLSKSLHSLDPWLPHL